MRVLLALLPLVAFYVVEAQAGLRPAIVASLGLALVEVGWTRWQEGRWSRLTAGSAALVVGLGGLSLASEDPTFVLITPAIGDVLLAAVLGGSLMLGDGVLVTALREQDPGIDLHPLEHAFLRAMSARLSLNLLVHALLVGWSAGQGRELWLLVTGPVQLAMLGVQVAAEVAWGRLVVVPRVEAAEAAAAEWTASSGRRTSEPEEVG